MAALVRHRQTKVPATDRRHLNHRVTSRLYRDRRLCGGEISGGEWSTRRRVLPKSKLRPIRQIAKQVRQQSRYASSVESEN
jgi:hypothetical protein